MAEKIIAEKPITMAELKEELEKIKKRDIELNFRANKTTEYLNQFTLLDKKKSEELFQKIAGLKVPRLKNEQIIKIIDTLPKTVADLKLVLQSYSVSITNENLKKIVDAVQPFVPE